VAFKAAKTQLMVALSCPSLEAIFFVDQHASLYP
jgi:hypothetical protein